MKTGGFIMPNKDKIKGKVNEVVGKVTDDKSKELKGKAQQKAGEAKEKGKEFADNVAKDVNDRFDEDKEDDKK